MVKILIADDHAVLREGLRALLDARDGWQVIAEASNGFEVLPLVDKLQPDLLIMDLSMPNLGGIETIVRLKKTGSKTAILVLSAREDEVAVQDVVRAGANGYVPISSDAEELEFAIRSVLRGQTYLSPSIAGSIIGKPGEDGSFIQSPFTSLSSREREVMKLLSEGKPNRGVAKALHISPRTVDSHRANIMKKLGISSNAELVQVAMRHGLLDS